MSKDILDLNKDGKVDKNDVFKYIEIVDSLNDNEKNEFILNFESSLQENRSQLNQIVIEALNCDNIDTDTKLKIKDAFSRFLPEIAENLSSLKEELTEHNVFIINKFVKEVLQSNRLDPSMSLVLMNHLSNSLSQFPNISKELSKLGDLLNKSDLNEEDILSQTRIIVQSFLDKGYYINTNILFNGGDFLIKVEGEKKPSNTLLKLFNEKDYQGHKSYVIKDPNFKSQGYNVGGFNIVNDGRIKSTFDFFCESGRFTDQQRNCYNIESMSQAVVDHEATHTIIGVEYNFPQRQAWDIKEGKERSIDGLEFVPNNSIQVEEFITNAIGQETDNYELVTNIGNAINDMAGSESIKYEIGAKGGDYALVRSVVLESLAEIMKDKGNPNFKDELVNKIQGIMNEQNTLSKKYKALIKDKKFDEAESISREWANSGKGKLVDQNMNQVVGDIIRQLDEKDFQRIQSKFMEQSKKYVSQIKQRYTNNKVG